MEEEVLYLNWQDEYRQCEFKAEISKSGRTYLLREVHRPSAFAHHIMYVYVWVYRCIFVGKVFIFLKGSDDPKK